MAILKESTWQKHSNPWSGWSRAASFPVLLMALWFGNLYLLLGVLIFILINPRLFKKPKEITGWMSKAVYGERYYTQDGMILKKDLPSLLNALNAIAFPVAAVAAYLNWFTLAVCAGILSLTFKFWFLDRMVWYYETQSKLKVT